MRPLLLLLALCFSSLVQADTFDHQHQAWTRLLQQHVSREALNDYYREEGQDAVRSALETLRNAKIEPVLHLHVGPPAETIARYAEQHDCEMIVMGRRGHGALASFALGSIASGVLHHSKRPVLLVR